MLLAHADRGMVAIVCLSNGQDNVNYKDYDYSLLHESVTLVSFMYIYDNKVQY